MEEVYVPKVSNISNTSQSPTKEGIALALSNCPPLE